MDDPNITIEEYIRLEEEKARRRGKVSNWETATYGKIWCDEDVHDLRYIETNFPAIVYNDALATYHMISSEPMVSPLNNNEINFKISFNKSDDEDFIVMYYDNSFSYTLISVNDLKTDSENDINKVNISLEDVIIEPSENVIDDNVNANSDEFENNFETNHDIHHKIFKKIRA
nr:hypothetical protein [Tanacetum cinerariifolium]